MRNYARPVLETRRESKGDNSANVDLTDSVFVNFLQTMRFRIQHQLLNLLHQLQ